MESNHRAGTPKEVWYDLEKNNRSDLWEVTFFLSFVLIITILFCIILAVKLYVQTTEAMLEENVKRLLKPCVEAKRREMAKVHGAGIPTTPTRAILSPQPVLVSGPAGADTED